MLAETDDVTLTEAQNEVVQALAARAPAGWRRIVADIEVLEEAGGYAMDSVAFAIVPQGGDYADPAIEVDRTVRDTVAALYRALRDGGEARTLGSLMLTIEQDGTYRFDYDYARPRRLNGEWDAEKEARLDDYLAMYRAEQATR